ncbi:MAG: DNA adenine methylase [Halothermotrichaceae bacterium]
MYDNIQIIRYMGNKNGLLDFIIPEITEITEPGDTILDLMAGTNSVGYALKKRNRIISNDIQMYSYIIGKAIIENDKIVISEESAGEEIRPYYQQNLKNKDYRFFYDNYADTYFARQQCLDVDSIRYGISQLENPYKKALYLSVLMYVMNKVQSSPGHFAQYMPKDHPRIIPKRQMNVWEIFLEKCNEFDHIINNGRDNLALHENYKNIFELDFINDVSCFYLDPPYTGEQYSRFYHVLETVVKYDKPQLNYKGLYREGRFKSNFCYKSKVEGEFEFLMKEVSKRDSKLVISYSNKGLLAVDRLKSMGNNYFNDTALYHYKYQHSTQGKGTNNVKEILLVLQ